MMARPEASTVNPRQSNYNPYNASESAWWARSGGRGRARFRPMTIAPLQTPCVHEIMTGEGHMIASRAELTTRFAQWGRRRIHRAAISMGAVARNGTSSDGALSRRAPGGCFAPNLGACARSAGDMEDGASLRMQGPAELASGIPCWRQEGPSPDIRRALERVVRPSL